MASSTCCPVAAASWARPSRGIRTSTSSRSRVRSGQAAGCSTRAPTRTSSRPARARRQEPAARPRRRAGSRRRGHAVGWGIFYNAGQTCNAGSRVLVQRAIKDAFLERLVAFAEALAPADPLDPATRFGSLVGGAHLETMLGYVARAARGRARRDGRRPALTETGGAYLPPTILDGVTERDARRAGGDLRAGAHRARVRRPGRGGRARQRHRLRPGCGGLDVRRAARHIGSRAGCGPASSGSTPSTRPT